MSNQAEAWIIRPANTLHDKVTGGDPNVKITLDDDMLRRAQSAINDMGEVFEDDLKDGIAALAQLLDAARADLERRAGFLADVVRHCHEIRGQAGTYGYPLLSEFASSLCDFVTDLGHVDDAHMEIVRAHIDVIQVVLAGGLKDDGGDAGKELKTMLAVAIQKRG
jgi:HPt (histidine-containing phosphotransfer) domain-containing protein